MRVAPTLRRRFLACWPAPLRQQCGPRSRSHLVDQAAEDAIRVEALLRESPRRARVPVPVRVDGTRRCNCFFWCGEGEQAVAGLERITKTGILHDCRTTRREVARGPVAHPSCAGLYVHPFGCAELRE